MSRSAVLSLFIAMGCANKSDPAPPDRMVEPDGAIPVAVSADASPVETSIDLAADAAADPLFTDPGAPHCQFGTPSLHIRAQLEGQSIDDQTYRITYFDRRSFAVTTVVNGEVRYDLQLTWSQPLAEDKAIPLTGASFIVGQGQPLAGRKYCITSGLFGSPSPPPGVQGRMVFFRITGARAETCSGPEVPVALAGCAFRTTSYPFVSQDGGFDSGP